MERLEELEQIANYWYGSAENVLRGLTRTTPNGDRDQFGHPKTHEGYIASEISKAAQTASKQEKGEQ